MDLLRAHVGAGRLGVVVRVAVDEGWFEVAGSAADPDGIVELAERHPEVIVLDGDRLGGDRAIATAVRSVRRTSPETKVVVVSGGEEETAAPNALADGAAAYMGADLPSERIVEELRHLLTAALGEVGTRMRPHPANAARARRMVGRTLETWGLDDLVDTVVLLLGELVTNAIRHAGSDFDVVVRLLPDAVRVEVLDAADGKPSLREVGHLGESGRGLLMVDAAATRWGVDPRGAGKVVWFEMPVEG